MIKKVSYPRYVSQGIVKNHDGFPKRYKLFGADSETVNGEPYTLQFYDGKNNDLLWVNRDTVLPEFLHYITPRMLSGHINLMYFHNLEFDLGVIFAKYHKYWLSNNFLELHYYDRQTRMGWDIDLCIGKITFAKFKNRKLKKQLQVLDSKAFFVNVGKRNLGYLAEQLKLPVKKLPVPEGIGDKKLTDQAFIDYAKNDAVVEYLLADWIVNQYKEYDTRICVSSPQFAARVFRHYFLKENDCIPFPPMQVLEPAILSYHGGKNGYYPPDGDKEKITVVNDCYEVDIVSAYPYAMTKLPNFLKGYYWATDKYTNKYAGIWCVTGKYLGCKYPSLFTHDFKIVQPGPITELWVTGYELEQALKYKEITIDKIYGYIWKPSRGVKRNPLSDYVDNFFKLKDKTPKTDNRYMLYKILLNSLYGKFVQTIDDKKKEVDLDEPDYVVDENTMEETSKEVLWRAGGLFNPFIASLITGYVRSYLHELEHTYQAFHSSTDSIKTKIKPAENAELGGVKIECFGSCFIFRNKLYLHYNKENELKKYALHGFQGRPEQLLKAFQTKNPNYKIKHLFKVREAYRQDVKPLAMSEVARTVDVDFSKVQYV